MFVIKDQYGNYYQEYGPDKIGCWTIWKGRANVYESIDDLPDTVHHWDEEDGRVATMKKVVLSGDGKAVVYLPATSQDRNEVAGIVEYESVEVFVGPPDTIIVIANGE